MSLMEDILSVVSELDFGSSKRMNVGTIKNSVVVTKAPRGAGRRRRCLTLFLMCVQSSVLAP